MRSRKGVGLMSVAITLMLVGATAAQPLVTTAPANTPRAATTAPAPVPSPAPGAGAAARPASSARSREMLADLFTQMAVRFHSPRSNMDSSYLHCQQRLLDYALQADDSNAEIWHLRAELSHQLGDKAGEQTALARYLKLRPDDDGAQWAILTARVNQMQTVDRRVAAMEAVLQNPAAQSFSAALRSRIASYAAEGYREMGDMARCAQRARQAADLDATNSRAAQLVYELTMARRTSVDEIGAAVCALVRAQPAAVGPRRILADLLISVGSYRRATQQYQAAEKVLGQPADVTFYGNWALSLAASDKSEDALALLNELDNAWRQAKAGGPTTAPAAAPATQPARSALPTELGVLRIMLLRNLGQSTAAETALHELETDLQGRIQTGDASAETDLAWISLFLAGRSPEPEALARFTKQVDSDPVSRRIVAWAQLVQGQDQGKLSMAALAKSDPFAVYGMAQWYKNDPAKKAALLQQTVAASPNNLAALMAIWDLQAMKQELTIAPDASALAKRYDQLPATVRDLELDGAPWTSLSMQVNEEPFAYLAPMTATIRLKNTSALPLSLGTDGAINGRLLITETPLSQGKPVTAAKAMIVADLARHLRIERNQTIELPVRLDWDTMGYQYWSAPLPFGAFSLVATLDPRLGPAGNLVPGPLGATDSVFAVRRGPFMVTADGVKGWITSLHGSSETARLEAMALIAAVGPAMVNSSDDSVRLLGRQVTDALNTEFTAMDGWEQAWTQRFITPAAPVMEQFKPILQLAQASDQPMVRLVYLGMFANDPQGGALLEAMKSTNPVVAEFAGNIQKILIDEKAAQAAQNK